MEDGMNVNTIVTGDEKFFKFIAALALLQVSGTSNFLMGLKFALKDVLSILVPHY